LNTYCIDTSAFIDNPKIIELLGECEIIVPFCVLGELDRNRKREGTVGRNAREAVRNIDKITKDEAWRGGADTGFGGKLRLIMADFEKPTNDLKIIACAEWIQSKEKADIILLSNDLGLRIQAEAHGIRTKEYKGPNQDFIYSGVCHLELDQEEINKIHECGSVEVLNSNIIMDEGEIYPNQMIIITNFEEKGSTLVRAEVRGYTTIFHRVEKRAPFGIIPGSVEQTLAVDLLLNKKIELVSLIGKAGCGKTFVAIASGLEQVLEKKIYERIIILRPIVPMGRDIGFLPGTMEEKMAPWIQPIKDNLITLFKGNKKSVDFLFETDKITVEVMSYIRGRSIPNSYIIVDECQNLSLEHLKTVITRAGEGSKIVLTGDVEQIDNTSIDAMSNGLSCVIEAFKEEDISGHITLLKGQRSKLATLASQIL
jgi:PhoH-like ATPase